MGFPWNEVGSVGAAVAGIASAIAAGFAVRISAGAKRAAVEQVATSKDAAAAAGSSAEAAVSSARVAALLAKMEVDRRHDELAPLITIDTFWRRNERTQKLDLFVELTNESKRDYQFGARKVIRENVWQDALSSAFGVGERVEIWIVSEDAAVPQALWVDFEAVDKCPCPRVSEGGRHWQRRIAIKVPPATKGRY